MYGVQNAVSTLVALEKLYNQRKFLSKMERVHNKLKDSCKRKDLQSAMRKVVVVRRKEEVISRNILWKRSTMQNQKSDFSERKNGSFSKRSNSKEKL